MSVKICPFVPPFPGLPQIQIAAWDKICLPVPVVCDPNPDSGPIRDCEDTWNNAHCVQDENYSMAYLHGDLIQFQTKFRDFWNTDPENPDDGWNLFVKAKLISNDDGSLLSDDVALFASRYYVAWNGVESIQVLEVDTSLPIFDDVICWHIEFESYRIETVGEGEEEVSTTIIDSTACTEDWCDCGDCEAQPLLTSNITGYDGHGYWHGDVSSWVGNEIFIFQPSYRFPLEIVQIGGQMTKETTRTQTLSFEGAAVFHVGTFIPVPPYVLNMLVFGFLSGRLLTFAGETYSTEDVSIRRTNKRSEMQVFTFELLQYVQQEKREC
jgi:hypothetical protein